MLRSSRYKFIFIHAPKNAGSSIAGQLIPYADFRPIKYITTPMRKLGFPVNLGAEPLSAHSTASEILELLGDSYFSYFSFGFTRNPFDRIYSLYSYIKFSKVRNPHGYKLAHCTGVNDYIANVLGVTHFPATQFDYFYSAEKQLIVSYLGKVESMNQSLQYISQKLSIPLTLKHVNKSQTQPRSESLTDDSIAKITDYFHNDFEPFGYKRFIS